MSPSVFVGYVSGQLATQPRGRGEHLQTTLPDGRHSLLHSRRSQAYASKFHSTCETLPDIRQNSRTSFHIYIHNQSTQQSGGTRMSGPRICETFPFLTFASCLTCSSSCLHSATCSCIIFFFLSF